MPILILIAGLYELPYGYTIAPTRHAKAWSSDRSPRDVPSGKVDPEPANRRRFVFRLVARRLDLSLNLIKSLLE